MAKKKKAKKPAASPAKGSTRQAKKVNKSQAIRDYWAKHPTEGPTEISNSLAKRGVEVSPAQVSNVLSASRKKGNEGAAGAGSMDLSELMAAQRFAERVGGFDSAKVLLDTLKKLGR